MGQGNPLIAGVLEGLGKIGIVVFEKGISGRVANDHGGVLPSKMQIKMTVLLGVCDFESAGYINIL
ncbi:hypothetical protein GCM10007924_23360 [Sneathiella chinensis]|uniref:Uncharacterized protein n=1 Tax=Sneathiella chinensis TaxID=349750 RepID=A0ABQ5U602_9PROT|nr:hypothetical protein GCM10007924_23360 [Sneathiella chinensis]